MKAFLLVVIVGVCLLSCKKGELVSPGLFGKWELRRMYGGLYWRDSSYQQGNGTIYQFNTDSTYKFFVKGKLNAQGIFHYRKNGYDPGGPTKYDAILFDNTVYGEMIVVNGNKLTIGNTWTDNIAYDYVKVSN
ncbi:MAG TPA: hypothetical protein VK668_21820 [Mucilaginibacter sp.]|nr:hypothetical protein [Mucilaginibacter sp.]